MGLHLALLAKFNLMATNQMSLTTPIVISLLWPFMLKLFFSFRPLREALYDTAYGLRLFLFQMGQIAFGPEPEQPPLGSPHQGLRWERALRLVYERMSRARPPQYAETDEESLRTLSVLAL